MKRRSALAALGGAISLSGCLRLTQGSGGDTATPSETESSTQTPASTVTEQTETDTEPIRQQWRYQIGEAPSRGRYQPEVYSGKVFVPTGSKLYSIDSPDGSADWVYQGRTKQCFVNQSSLYALTDTGIARLSPETGDTVWDIEMFARKMMSVEGSTGFVAGGARDPSESDHPQGYRGYYTTVHAIDLVDGDILWTKEVPDAFTGSPVIVGDQVIVITGNDSIQTSTADYSEGIKAKAFSFDKEDGTRVWKKEFDKAVGIGPVANGENVYFGVKYMDGSSVTRLVAFNGNNGAVRWKEDDIGIGTALSTTDDHVFCDIWEGLKSFSHSGEVQWEFNGSGTPRRKVVTQDDRAYVSASKGWIYAIDTSDGSKIWEYQTRGLNGAPAVKNNHIYLLSSDGNIYSLVEST